MSIDASTSLSFSAPFPVARVTFSCVAKRKKEKAAPRTRPSSIHGLRMRSRPPGSRGRAADRASKARMFEAKDGRAGARSTSTAKKFADATSAKPSCLAHDFGDCPRKASPRRRTARKKTRVSDRHCESPDPH